MSAWETLKEEASIVLVGNFNPKIFHPEWFIRKEIIEEWDYSKEELVSLQDMSQISLPSSRILTVLLNQFNLRSSLASDHLALKDLVTSTFTILRETPILQMGMNFTSVIKIKNKEDWLRFGSNLAPKQYWENAIDYIKDLDVKEREKLGLWEMTMNLPRNDDKRGYIRPKISAISQSAHDISFSINNHVEIEPSNALTMVQILEEQWDNSLSFANKLTSNIMTAELKDKT